MARDASETRERLVAEARRLFAAEGVHRVKVADIVAAAGQRNPSALTYHFGSRAGVLREILDRHNEPIDAERGQYLALLGPDPSTRQLIAALLRPYSTQLETLEGRQYLRIVAQIGGDVADLDSVAESVPGINLQRVFRVLLERPAGLAPELRRDRLIGAVILMSGSMAERARHIDAGERVSPDAEDYLTNLADMLVALLDAPPGDPLPRRVE
jgi:AcrR family transcriptional regulator